jgi:hypothetical protein
LRSHIPLHFVYYVTYVLMSYVFISLYATVLCTMKHLWDSCKVGPCDMALNQYEPNPDSPNSHNPNLIESWQYF